MPIITTNEQTAFSVGATFIRLFYRVQHYGILNIYSFFRQNFNYSKASYRKVTGPARFLHNGTYLLCDTALWNVESNIIDAWGHVSILQEETVLTSDNLQYLIDEDLAQFRGTLVQLEDKDHNTLRMPLQIVKF